MFLIIFLRPDGEFATSTVLPSLSRKIFVACSTQFGTLRQPPREAEIEGIFEIFETIVVIFRSVNVGHLRAHASFSVL